MTKISLKKIFASLLLLIVILVTVFLMFVPWHTKMYILSEIVSVSSAPIVTPQADLKYSRNLLNEDEKKIYDKMYYSIEEKKTSMAIPKTSTEIVSKIHKYYLNDSPNHFYLKETSFQVLDDHVVGINFNYSYTDEEIETKQNEIEAIANKFIATVPENATDYEKSKLIYDYIISKNTYDLSDDPKIYTIEGAFLDNKIVCQGYAKAYQYLANLLGMQSLYVTGTSRGESHGWNLVRLDDKYYYVDTTWGDLEEANIIDYSFLHITSDELLKTHVISDSQIGILPEVTDITNGYYIKNNLIIGNPYDETDKMIKIFSDNLINGQKYLDLKFADETFFEKFKNDDNLKSDIINGSKKIYNSKVPNETNFSLQYTLYYDPYALTVKVILT